MVALPLGLGLCPFGFQFLMGAKAGVGVTISQKLFKLVTEKGCPLRLTVGSKGASQPRSLIPIQAQPLQVPYDAFLNLGLGPFPVRILDAQDEFPAHVPGEKPIKEGGTGSPDMQISCGTG